MIYQKPVWEEEVTMQCKYCHTELEEGNNICPNCGTVNKEKNISKKLKVMKILTFSLIGVILLSALVGAISYGQTGKILPGWFRKNDIYNKTSYSVSAEKLNSTLGNKAFQKNRDAVVATMGEHKLTNRMLQVYYWDIVSSSEFADLDTKKPLDQQYQNAASRKTWQQYFIEKAIETWQRDTIVWDMAQEAGFEMPASYVSQFDALEKDIIAAAKSNNFTSADAFLESMLGTGTNFQIYYDYLWNYFIGGLYWGEYTETVEVTMEQIEAYYEAHQSELKIEGYFPVNKETGNLVDVRHILLKPATSVGEDGKTTITDEAWADCETKAQAILDEWLKGEHTEESFAALASEKTEDSGSKSTGGLYTDVCKGMMVDTFDAWCFDESRQYGDYGMVKTEYGYHIMYFVGAEEGWIRLSREGAKSERATEIMNEMVAQTSVKVNYRKIALAELD